MPHRHMPPSPLRIAKATALLTIAIAAPVATTTATTTATATTIAATARLAASAPSITRSDATAHIAADSRAAPADLPFLARLGGPLGAILLENHTVYASFDHRLHAYDVADPTHPRELGSGPIGPNGPNGEAALLPGTMHRMAFAPDEDRLFGLIDWDQLPAATVPDQARLVVLDIAASAPNTLGGDHAAAGADALSMRLAVDIALPVGVGRWPSAGDSDVVALGGGWAAVAGPGVVRYRPDNAPGDPDRLVLVDARDPAHAAVTSVLPLTGTVVSLTANGRWLYVVTRTGDVSGLDDTMAHVIAFDVRDPLRPARCGMRDVESKAVDLTVRGGYGYLVAFDSVHVLDLTTPCAPTVVGQGHALAEFPPLGREMRRFAYPADTAAWLGADLLVPSHDDFAGFGSYLRVAVDAFADFRSVGRVATRGYAGNERLALDGQTSFGQSGDDLSALEVTTSTSSRVAATLAPLLQPQHNGIAADRGRMVYWTDAGSSVDLLTALDPRTLREQRRDVVGRSPDHTEAWNITAALAGRWVAQHGDWSVSFIDVGDPSTPERLAAPPLAADRRVTDLAAVGTTLYVADRQDAQPSDNAVAALDASGPILSTRWRTATVGDQIAAERDRLYTAVSFYDSSSSAPAAGILQVLRVTPSAAESTAALPLDHGIADLAADDHRVYLLDLQDRVHVYDARDPNRPARVGTIDAAPPNDGMRHYPLDAITVRGRTVFVAGPDRLVAIDAADAAAPRFVAERRFAEPPHACPPTVSCDHGYAPPGLALAGDTLLVNVLGLGVMAFDIHALAPDDERTRRMALPWVGTR
ncbi:MAG: hypothetical protein ABI780_14465 [Ardenticatenales bacterium]